MRSEYKIWKDKVWKRFSIFIRTRDADENGMVNCVTCGIWKHWKEGDAGHFLAGRYNSNLFDERGCHFQCKPCNAGDRLFYQNRKVDVKKNYRAYMLQRYGIAVIKELERNNRKTKQFTVKELKESCEKYESMLRLNQ